ncbi:unnamed protein product [Caretta caretta]
MILRDSLPKGCPVPKSLSGTRWSANTEAVNAVVLEYPNILEVLESVKDDESQKLATKDAKILSQAMCTLETGILCEVWNDILQPFSRCSLSLQSAQIDLSTAVNLLRSLGTVLQQMRDSFDEYEIQGAVRTANHENKSAKCCKRQKTCNNAHSFSDKEAFRVNTFITIINKLKSSLEHWIEAYENIDKTFRVLTHFSPNISSSEVSEGIRHLCQKYPDDLPVDFTKEFFQFVEFTSLSGIWRKDDESKSIWMY